MSDAWAITSLFDNIVATIFVARCEGSLDLASARAVLNQSTWVKAAVLAE